MQKILLAIDSSEITFLLIAQAATIAQRFNGQVWLVHIALPDPAFIGHKICPDKVRHYVAEGFSNEHQHQFQNKWTVSYEPSL